jgi:beta-glucosidase
MMKIRHFSIVAGAIMALAAMGCSSEQKATDADIPYPVLQEHRDRAAELVSQMTLEEKCDYIGGSKDGFYIRPVERLGIPLIRMADGPQGVRNNTKSTLFACGVAAAASWNEDVVYEMGVALGQDSRARGVHILLGPGVNIYRSPLCGRNFEYMGEDPTLAGNTAAQYIKGVQSQGVMATVKHFALNNQEFNRHHTSSDADERTMYEIYFPAFKAAVDAGVASVMSSYNLVNNVHAAENRWLLTDVLKDEWGFDGFVMSDWTSTYSTLGCVRSGLDLEMPHGFCLKYEHIKPLIETGVISEKDIDRMVEAILSSVIAYGFLDRPQLDTTIKEDHPYSREVAYKLSCESAVLLKNNGALPLKKGGKVALMGPRAEVIPCGGGSGAVDPIYSISLSEGMTQLGEDFPVTLIADDYKSKAKEIQAADAVVVSVGFDKKTEREDHDRTFSLPEGQDELIEFALANNDNVIVVVYSGGGIDMSRWQDKVSAIVMGWYPGQEGGLAIARMLAGEFSPSGRLPMTIESRLEDNPTFTNYYVEAPMTKRGHSTLNVTYGEGVFVGYRGYEKSGVKPAYPFGHGLTYTTFEYSDLFAKAVKGGVEVAFTLTNTGDFDASEVAQVYVGEVNPTVPRPAKELKGYSKVFVKAGESAQVKVFLPKSAFAFYNVDVHDWTVNPGAFDINVGASVADIRLCEQVGIK